MASTSATLLIVDDDPGIRAVVRAYLSGETYAIIEAGDGEEAWKLLGEFNVDLVITDILMPGVDGLELTGRIRARQGAPWVPVIVMSAADGMEKRLKALESGADDFVGKPPQRVELVLRTRNLVRMRADQQLIQQQMRRLKELQSLKNELTSLVMHDLRNPLSGALAYMQALEMDRLIASSPAALDDVRGAIECMRHMSTILESVLDLQVLEEEERVLQCSPVSLAQIADDAARTLRARARMQDVALEVRAEGDAACTADAPLVRRSVENLIVNAIRYAPPGTTVVVHARTVDHHAILSVADQGPGIPDEHKRDMFTQMMALARKRQGARTGYGMGLQLVRRVMTMHGGDVSVRDREGGGAIFELRFPC